MCIRDSSLPGTLENAIPKRNHEASQNEPSGVFLQLCLHCNSLKDMRTEFIEVQRLALAGRITSSVSCPSQARSLLASRKSQVVALAGVRVAALTLILVHDRQVLWLAQGRVSAHGEVVHQHVETIVAHHVLQAARNVPPAAPGAVAGLHDAEVSEFIARAIAGVITGEAASREAASRKHSGVDGLSFVVDEVTHSPAPVTGVDA